MIYSADDVDGSLTEGDDESEHWECRCKRDRGRKYANENDVSGRLSAAKIERRETRLDRKEPRTFLSPTRSSLRLKSTSIRLASASSCMIIPEVTMVILSEFHERSTVRSEDDTLLVQRVGRIGGHDSIEGHLRAYQENKECYRSSVQRIFCLKRTFEALCVGITSLL